MNYHFTPQKGWMNDPNGLIYIDGTYHVFYQHYPDDIVWGPMHWGHAISKDLINWSYLPIALYPDELGYIFSGSCILDVENVSGLGRFYNVSESENKDNETEGKYKAPLLAFFTHHNSETGEQQQSVAYSFDYINFTKYELNPIISNTLDMDTYKADFRDPKVFRNTVIGGYSMVLAAGRVIEIYHSDNLLSWEMTGEFDPSLNGHSGITECPDLFCPDNKNWVLTLSHIVDERKYMHYFIGDFDGYTFVNTLDNDTPLFLDYGPDNYAMVSFSGTEETLLLGWGENWDYVNNTKAGLYRGKLTIPRKAELIDTPCGLRLSMMPVISMLQEGCESVEGCGRTSVNITSNHKPLVSEYILSAGTELSLDGVLTIRADVDKLTIERNKECFPIDIDFDKYHHMEASRVINNRTQCNLTVIYDEGYYEIFADEGTIVISVMTYAGTSEKADNA